MKQNKGKQKGMTLVALVVTITILIILAGISLNVTIGENGIITKTKQAKQNITLAGEAEAMQLNQLYYELEAGGELTEDEENSKKDEIISLLQKQVEELQKQVADLQTENTELKKQIQELTEQIANLQQEIESLKQQIMNKDIEIAELEKQVSEKEAKIKELQDQLANLNFLLSQTNTTADKILAGYKAYSRGKLLTGTMTNQGAVSSILNCGQSYTIPVGYHNGAGKVTANSLASQTSATAVNSDILTGKTAWVNGAKITGTKVDSYAIPPWSTTVTPSASINSQIIDVYYTFSIPEDRNVYLNVSMNVPANNGAGNQVIAYVKSNNQTVGGYGEKLGSLISANTAGTYQGNLTIPASKKANVLTIGIHCTHSGNNGHSSIATYTTNFTATW